MATVNPVQIQKFLKGVNYPASRQDLIHQAEQHGADQNVRDALDRLPDIQFQTPADVSQAIGKLD
jgi:hypothetical protein